MNTMFLPTTSSVAPVEHNIQYCSAQCCRKLSSANRWWHPGLGKFLRVNVLRGDNPKWLSNTSFRHVFSLEVLMRIPLPYVPST